MEGRQADSHGEADDRAGRDGSERIVTESPTWLAKFRDGRGLIREISTGCKDETAARAVLGELEKRAEKVRSGIITSSEELMTAHQHSPLTEHLAEFIATMRAAGRAESHFTGTERLIQRVIDEAGFRRLSDIKAEAVERWLAQQTVPQADKPTMGARTRNSYLVALRTFCNWCVERDRSAAADSTHWPSSTGLTNALTVADNAEH